MALTKATHRMIDGASVNVKDFGAVGDGVTDDTVAIQAAIDSLPVSTSVNDPSKYGTGGGTVLLPIGTFKISSPITVYHNITLKGAGKNSSVIQVTGNIDAIQIKYNYTLLNDYTVGGVSLEGFKIDGSTTAEAGITNRSGSDSYPISNCKFSSIDITGCKVGMHLFGGWNNSFREIHISAEDYNSATSEGIVGFIAETVSLSSTYGPSGHTVTAQGGSGGFNNNLFDTVVILYMKRIGMHIRAVSTSHSYTNTFLNCNFEQILKQATPQTYAPYTDTTVTPEGESLATLKWQGEAVGVHLLGRTAGVLIQTCYFEAIQDKDDVNNEGGVGVVFDDVGVEFAAGASKSYRNLITTNFFNANVERTVNFGRCDDCTLICNAVLKNTTGSNAGYLVDTDASHIEFIGESTGNIDSSSSDNYSWMSSVSGLGLKTPKAGTVGTSITVDVGATPGIEFYRDGGSANFSAIKFNNSDNSTNYAQIGFNTNELRLEGTNVASLHAASGEKLRVNSTTGATGGTGSAGAGNQYVELNIAGVRYKLLHDGTI
jgi:hypothetical protein